MRLGLPLFLATFVLACTRGDDVPAVAASISVTDDTGVTVALERPATRVISMIPAQTEITAILGGVDVIIARTQWDLDPRLAHLPTIGDALTPSVEWLAAQRPDLVIAWPDAQSRDVVTRLREIGVPVYGSRVESITEIRAMVTRLGVLLGAVERADSLVRALDAGLDSVRASVAGRPAVRVLYLLSADPATIAGPGTFVDEIVSVAGGVNVFADVPQLWPQVSLEEVVKRQPDVIIRPSEPARDPLADLLGQPGWRDLHAVQNGRVYMVDANLFNRAGVTVVEAARRLASLVHDSAAEK